MAFRARTAENVGDGKIGGGVLLDIDGSSFGPRIKKYGGTVNTAEPRLVDSTGAAFGAPTAAMLASDSLMVRTLADDLPWPGSSEDRHGKGICQNGMTNALLGASSPFGSWPSRLEQVCQANHSLQERDPKGHAERVLTQRAYTDGEKALVRAKASARSLGMDEERIESDGMDVGSLPAPGGAAEPVARRATATAASAPESTGTSHGEGTTESPPSSSRSRSVRGRR